MAYSLDEISRQVIAGKWGNGSARRSRLTAAGYNYNDVQNRVNQMMGGGSSRSSSKAAAPGPAPLAPAVPSYEQGEPVYADSQDMTNYKNKLTNLENNKPGDYAFSRSTQSNTMLDDILNRKGFTYDFNADPLYQQYKDQYTRQGNLAMRDTMGNAAALSGGYGNSYATAAGNQAYQGYLSQLNNVIPELYSAAYDRYKDEGDQMRENYGLLQDLNATEYGQYRDKIGDYNNELNYLAGRYDSAGNTNMDRYKTDVSQYDTNREYGYTKDKDAKDYALQEEELAKKKESELTTQNSSQKEYKTTFQKNLEFLEGKDRYGNCKNNDVQIAEKIWSEFQSDPEYLLEMAKECTLPGGNNLAELLDKVAGIKEGNSLHSEFLTPDGLTVNPSFW